MTANPIGGLPSVGSFLYDLGLNLFSIYDLMLKHTSDMHICLTVLSFSGKSWWTRLTLSRLIATQLEQNCVKWSVRL